MNKTKTLICLMVLVMMAGMVAADDAASSLSSSSSSSSEATTSSSVSSSSKVSSSAASSQASSSSSSSVVSSTLPATYQCHVMGSTVLYGLLIASVVCIIIAAMAVIKMGGNPMEVGIAAATLVIAAFIVSVIYNVC